MSAVVEVAAAVLLRASVADASPPPPLAGEGVSQRALMTASGGREFLLAQRPEGKVYAGYWEFPGGKVEAGESIRDALLRELREELGIAVTACSPWLVRQFEYPHATVRLHFWRVTAWEGEIGVSAPLEHAAVDWQTCGAPARVAPILPANDPILKALGLPTTMLITMAEIEGVERCLERLNTALTSGLRLIQLRDKGLPPTARRPFAETVARLARDHGALLIVNDDADLARRVGADGLHLSSAALAACRGRPDFPWLGASCHNADDIARSARLGLDYAVLGPVLPTPTHPENPGLGWAAFSQLIAAAPLPVFALGGLRREMLGKAQQAGAHGVALMRGG